MTIVGNLGEESTDGTKNIYSIQYVKLVSP